MGAGGGRGGANLWGRNNPYLSYQHPTDSFRHPYCSQNLRLLRTMLFCQWLWFSNCRARWPEGLLRRRASKPWRHRRQLEKHPQKAPNLGLPRMLTKSWSIQDCSLFGTLFSTSKSVYELDLGGHLIFSIFFNDRLSYLKQYCRYHGPKSGPNSSSLILVMC